MYISLECMCISLDCLHAYASGGGVRGGGAPPGQSRALERLVWPKQCFVRFAKEKRRSAKWAWPGWRDKER